MNTKQLGLKEQEIMNFLCERIVSPILDSPVASEKLKQGVRLLRRCGKKASPGLKKH